MELFMITTGFYKVATRKEAERLAMAKWEAEEAERRRQERIARRKQEAGQQM